MSLEFPTLETSRLVLRPFAMSDAAQVQRLAGDKRIADMTLLIPHPYEDGMAETWIATHDDQFYNGRGVTLAITLAENGELIGAIGLSADAENRRAELGYWLGADYWGEGYCTEAAAAIVEYGFDVLKLHRIFAHHLACNPASGKVMQKIGMTREGEMIDHIFKDDIYHDIILYGMVNGIDEPGQSCPGPRE